MAVIAAHYPEWTTYGKGVTNYLAAPDFPLDEAGTTFATRGGYIAGGERSTVRPITTFGDAVLRDNVAESVKHAWYKGGKGALHPYHGETVAEFTGWKDEGKYSFVKSPTFAGKPAQVGPLARVLVAAATGDEAVTRHLQRVLGIVESLARQKLPPDALHSTLGRHAARAVMCARNVEILAEQWELLMGNIAKGDSATFARPAFPRGEVAGFGFHEAPRGMLSHWVVIEDGVIKNYQAVVPTTWNAAPRNEDDQLGPYESSLLGTPLADPEQPLEVLRTIHSFDPCLACAVHLFDPDRRDILQVRAL